MTDGISKLFTEIRVKLHEQRKAQKQMLEDIAGQVFDAYRTALGDDFTTQGLVELGFNPSSVQNIKLYKAVGCNQCTNGYKGRVGLFEVLPMSKSIGQIVMSGGNSLDILKEAQSEGMLTIYQSGLELA